jgi:hypothetical protein
VTTSGGKLIRPPSRFIDNYYGRVRPYVEKNGVVDFDDIFPYFGPDHQDWPPWYDSPVKERANATGLVRAQPMAEIIGKPEVVSRAPKGLGHTATIPEFTAICNDRHILTECGSAEQCQEQ